MSGKMEDLGFFLTRTFASTRASKKSWPYVPGKYFVLDPSAPIAVTTLGSVALAEEVSQNAPPGLNIVGKVETENIGIEKIIKNILSNPAIRYLVCAGNEPPKHLTGATLLALFENGINRNKRIPGSPGMRPVLPNTTQEEVHAFRQQVTPVNMIGCTEVSLIHARVKLLAKEVLETPPSQKAPIKFIDQEDVIERVTATGVDPKKIKLDKAGYFVIHADDPVLIVEQYDYKEKLVRIIEGKNAREMYLTLTLNGWVSRLDHAAYLGKELTRAEWCMKNNEEYIQDGA